MQFRADPALLRNFPGMALVAGVVRGIDNRAPSPELDGIWQRAWREAAALGLPNPQSHPHVAHLRQCFRGIVQFLLCRGLALDGWASPVGRTWYSTLRTPCGSTATGATY